MPFWESLQLQPLRAHNVPFSRSSIRPKNNDCRGIGMFRMAEQAGCCVCIFRRCRREGGFGDWPDFCCQNKLDAEPGTLNRHAGASVEYSRRSSRRRGVVVEASSRGSERRGIRFLGASQNAKLVPELRMDFSKARFVVGWITPRRAKLAEGWNGTASRRLRRTNLNRLCAWRTSSTEFDQAKTRKVR